MKENANPTIYAVSTNEDSQAKKTDLVATKYLNRLHEHHPTSENDSDTENDGDGNYDDSLFHLEPHRLLTPLERSIQTALSSIDSHGVSSSSSSDPARVKPTAASLYDSPLGILHLSGIQTTNNTRAKTRNNGTKSTCGMYYFKPSNSLHIHDNDHDHDNDHQMNPHATDNPIVQRDTITQREVFNIIRNIQDPEHPLTLQQLNVVSCNHVDVHDNFNDNDNDTNSQPTKHSTIDIKFTPTIPHCSMATLIGLCIRVKLLRSIPRRFKVIVRINPGTHASELAINRQLNDKERVVAALENVHLLSVVNKCIGNGMKD